MLRLVALHLVPEFHITRAKASHNGLHSEAIHKASLSEYFTNCIVVSG
jgi:hypothetical protein